MFATGMYLPGLLFRATFASAVFVVLFDFISDCISAGTVSIKRKSFFLIIKHLFSRVFVKPKQELLLLDLSRRMRQRV